MDVTDTADKTAPKNMGKVQARLDADRALVETRKLQPACACFFKASQTQAPRGIVLMLHGFTAGPWQYAYLADHLAQRGLHCYAARLPGHGASNADGVADSSLLPQSHQAALYAACAADALADIEALVEGSNLPLYIIGFSAGAALASDLLHSFPKKFTRAVLIAPLLKFYGRWTHLLFSSLVHMPFSGRMTNKLRLAWDEAPAAPDAWRRPGHGAFFLGNVQGLAAYTAQLRRHTQAIDVPCQFIMTGSDKKVDLAAGLALAQRGPKPHPVFCFPREAGIAHSMLTPHENPDTKSRLLLFDIVTSFLLDGQSRSQAPR